MRAQDQANKVGGKSLYTQLLYSVFFVRLAECGRALSWSSITLRSLVGRFFLDCVCKTSQLFAINVSRDCYTSGRQFLVQHTLAVPLDA